MPIVVVGLNHQSAAVTIRERFAFSEGQIPTALDSLRQAGTVQEAVILSTCNRVEIYASTPLEPQSACEAIRQFCLQFHNVTVPIADEVYTHSEPHSVQHLFKVACGLDSMVLGETEILGQLKKSYDLALKLGYTGPRLNKAFQRAFNVAKQIRTETNIQRGSISVGSVSVELAEKVFNTLADKQVMVIGAGDTSEKTARSLLSRGAAGIVVTNRSLEKAEALARELGGRAIPFHQWAEDFALIDIIISSTSATDYVIDRARLEPLLKLRRGKPLLLIDIAVPRDIEPEVNFMENVFLYNIDDLQAIAADYLKQRREEVAHCEDLIREKAAALLTAPNIPRSSN
ncbi:MAG: glutamyl-tRNA reductase [Verrucomicrobia bacterium]|jgi:glutamyl-tRNA reductase|nr:glutamyl-tRNA reductase [Verrucomicrobiota bacterium]